MKTLAISLLILLVIGVTHVDAAGVRLSFDADPFCHWQVEDGPIKDRMTAIELTAATLAVRTEITCSAKITLGPAPAPPVTPPPVARVCEQRSGSWCYADMPPGVCAVCTPPASKALTFEPDLAAEEAEYAREEERWAAEEEQWAAEEAAADREWCEANYCPVPPIEEVIP